MAQVQNPIIGRSKGTLGNAVFSTWKGINTLRSKALTVANPQTDGQMKQRAKLAVLLAIYQTISPIVSKGFKEVAVGMSEYNKFMAINLKNAFLSWSGSAWLADNSELQVAKGSLDDTSITSVTTSNGTATVAIAFPTTVSGDKSANDKVYALAINGDKIGYSLGSAVRSAGTVTLTMPSNNATSDDIDVYLFFASPDERKFSNSVYFAETV